jgi:hypothetical protein
MPPAPTPTHIGPEEVLRDPLVTGAGVSNALSTPPVPRKGLPMK